MASGPRAITVPLNAPAATVAFQLPPNVTLDVQSVYVDIDATAGQADPELVVAAPSGVVIARKRQSGSVAAGGTGSATWALRLTDEAVAASATGGNFRLLANANIGGAFPFGSMVVDAPEAILAGAPPPGLSVSWLWEWEAGKQGNVSLTNDTTTPVNAVITGAWVRDVPNAAREILQGTNVAIAPGGFALLPWQHVSGANLLNLATPTRPAPFATSVYAVAVTVGVS